MVISAWWLIVLLYQNILKRSSKTRSIITEKKYLPVFDVLGVRLEKTELKENIPKKSRTLKFVRRCKTKSSTKRMSRKSRKNLRDAFCAQYFLSATFSAFKVYSLTCLRSWCWRIPCFFNSEFRFRYQQFVIFFSLMNTFS